VFEIYKVRMTSTLKHAKAMLVSRFAEDRESIEAQVRKAVPALKKLAAKRQEQANTENATLELLPEAETITVTFTLNRIPVKKDYRFNEIVVPHKIISPEEKSLCLLVRDPKEVRLEQVKKESLPFEKVIAIKSLKRKYATLEARKELANRFDLFFCEEQIFESMANLLGSFFFEKRKAKIPMPLKYLSKTCFDKALQTARFRVRGGANVGIRIGNRGMDTEALVENAMAVIEHMASKYCMEARTVNDIYTVAIGGTHLMDLPVWSVPVSAPKPAEEEKPVVTPETPKKEQPAKPETPEDLAQVPVKKLKTVQKQRVEKAKADLGVVEKKQRTK
jgi:ribosomal protein L1